MQNYNNLSQIKEQQKIKVGISIGDPNGIGVEIILKIFEDEDIFDFFRVKQLIATEPTS